MKHTFVVTVDADSRYDAPAKQNVLCDLLVGRAWNIDGVYPHGASGFLKTEAVVHTRAEYDGMRQALRDRDSRIIELEAQLATSRKLVDELTADLTRLSPAPSGRYG